MSDIHSDDQSGQPDRLDQLDQLRELLTAANEQLRYLITILDGYHAASIFARPSIPVEMIPEMDLFAMRAGIIRIGNTWPECRKELRKLRKVIKRVIQDSENADTENTDQE